MTRILIAALAILMAGPSLADTPIPKPNQLRTQTEVPPPPPAVPTPQPTCVEIDRINDGLAQHFGEKPLVAMTKPDGSKIVLFGNPSTGSWTMVNVNRAGCVGPGPSGEGMRLAKPVPKGDPA